MSTVPTEVLDPTAVTEAALDIESIKELMDAFDPASLLPELGEIFGVITTVCQIAVMICPVILLCLGLAYLLLSPREANYYFGYRCYYGMGSVEAWRFTQRLAGAVWSVLGLVLTAIMLIVTLTFGPEVDLAMANAAFTCIVVELVLIGGACIGINVIVNRRFDRNGNVRPNTKIRFTEEDLKLPLKKK